MIDYSSRMRKRRTQTILFQNIYQRNFMGLCGTHVLIYLRKINFQKFDTVTLFETNIELYKKAVIDCMHFSNVTIINGNIGDYLDQKDTYYDLDFETTINKAVIINMLPKIAKLSNFSFTVCMRRGPKLATLATFNSFYDKPYKVLTYRDGPPMMIIQSN